MEIVAGLVDAAVVELVCVSFTRQGPHGEPSRLVSQYWSKDGRMLAEHDFLFHSPDVAVFRYLELCAEVKALKAELAAYRVEPDERAPREE